MVDEDRKRLGSIAKRCDEGEKQIIIGKNFMFFGEFTTVKKFKEEQKC